MHRGFWWLDLFLEGNYLHFQGYSCITNSSVLELYFRVGGKWQYRPSIHRMWSYPTTATSGSLLTPQEWHYTLRSNQLRITNNIGTPEGRKERKKEGMTITPCMRRAIDSRLTRIGGITESCWFESLDCWERERERERERLTGNEWIMCGGTGRGRCLVVQEAIAGVICIPWHSINLLSWTTSKSNLMSSPWCLQLHILSSVWTSINVSFFLAYNQSYFEQFPLNRYLISGFQESSTGGLSSV